MRTTEATLKVAGRVKEVKAGKALGTCKRNLKRFCSVTGARPKGPDIADSICINYPEQANPQGQKAEQWLSRAAGMRGFFLE